MAQPERGDQLSPTTNDGTAGSDWNDPEVFGDLSPKRSASEVPPTFRPVTRHDDDDDEAPVDTSRFLKKRNPWAGVAVGAGVLATLGLLGFAIARGPGHTAAEELVNASAGPHQEAREAVLEASLRIGRACGDGKATSPATVRATFASDGSVTDAIVVGPYAGTPVGQCVASKVRELHSQPFNGPSATVVEQISLRTD
jgi:hypothetical protein